MTAAGPCPLPVGDLELPRRVEALERCVVALQRQVARLEAAGHRTKGATGAALLRQIVAVVPAGTVFSAKDLLAHATVHPELAAALGTGNPRTIGHRLRAATRCPIDTVQLIAHSTDERGVIWMLEAVR
jgi:hypothetical protein